MEPNLLGLLKVVLNYSFFVDIEAQQNHRRARHSKIDQLKCYDEGCRIHVHETLEHLNTAAAAPEALQTTFQQRRFSHIRTTDFPWAATVNL